MAPRFFCPLPLAADSLVELPGAAAHHAARVLRLVRGDALVLFNGQGGEYPGTLVEAARTLRVQLGRHEEIERESPLEVTLSQALPAGDKMDFIVQKAVELGVARIQPLAAARSVLRLTGERAERRVAHWQQVAIAACEQCGRNRVPDIAPVASLSSWLAALPAQDEEICRLLLAPGATQRVRDLPGARRYLVLIGPEGGFDAGEIAAAGQAGFKAGTLGPRVLRAETAALALLCALGAVHGDL